MLPDSCTCVLTCFFWRGREKEREGMEQRGEGGGRHIVDVREVTDEIEFEILDQGQYCSICYYDRKKVGRLTFRSPS